MSQLIRTVIQGLLIVTLLGLVFVAGWLAILLLMVWLLIRGVRRWFGRGDDATVPDRPVQSRDAPLGRDARIIEGEFVREDVSRNPNPDSPALDPDRQR